MMYDNRPAKKVFLGKVHWISHILPTNVLTKQITEGNIEGGIEVTRRQGRRRKQLLDKIKETKGYCRLKGTALDCTVYRTGFGRGYGTVIKQTTE